MPLGAMVDGELAISSLFGDVEWVQLKADAKAKRISITMRCGWPAVAKTSAGRTRFFAHAPGGDGCTAPESREHLLAKAAIVDGIIAAGWTAEPEARGDGWVADVLATKDDRRAVFEVQWSRQTLEDYQYRQKRYENSGIKAIAWFVQHYDARFERDVSLRALPLVISDFDEAFVTVDRMTLRLADAVERMLAGRLRRREFVGGDHPAAARVVGATDWCYRCKEPFVVWDVSSLTARGRCGRSATRMPGSEVVMEMHRYEELPAVRTIGARLARSIGHPPANVKVMSSRTAERSYMGFACPRCGALCGEHFLYELFANRRPDAVIDTEIPAAPVHDPHWCLDDGDGLCAQPTAEWAAALRAADGRPNYVGRYRRLTGLDVIDVDAGLRALDHRA